MKVVVLFSTNAIVKIMNAGELMGWSRPHLDWHSMQWYSAPALAVYLVSLDVDECECVCRSWHGKALQRCSFLPLRGRACNVVHASALS